jgi:methylated-DNA-protein-cysteine methyltransferase-like protein
MVGQEQAVTTGRFEESVRRVLDQTQPGDVLTYGEVASEAGFPGAARAVGNLLRLGEGMPWWRVVAASGRLNPSDSQEHAERLRAEGHVVEPSASGQLRIVQ